MRTIIEDRFIFNLESINKGGRRTSKKLVQLMDYYGFVGSVETITFLVAKEHRLIFPEIYKKEEIKNNEHSRA